MATQEAEPLPAARTIALAIATALRADIAAGSLRAGDRLLQAELARRFDVSTTPVRESFAILQHEGLVRLHPQRGATVFIPSVEEVQEHYWPVRPSPTPRSEKVPRLTSMPRRKLPWSPLPAPVRRCGRGRCPPRRSPTRRPTSRRACRWI